MRRSRRSVALTAAFALALLALATASRTASSAPSARPIDPPGAPAGTHAAGDRPVSAIIVLSAPSVADRLAAARWRAWGAAAGDVAADAGRPGERARLTAWRAATFASQDDVVARADGLGLRVVARYAVVGNGVQVHGAARDVARLAGVPGVTRIEPAPIVRPMLDRSVPLIGATLVRERLGLDGAGQTIAIIDTGIDYTHATFGGPGTAAAYAQAKSGAERIDDTFDGRPLFPTAHVVGGWDFVGPNYTSPGLCSPSDEAAGNCTGTPHPDPDPLDQYGHGTLVASIAAGQGGGDVAPGVAPAASLVALKVFGPPTRLADTDEAADVVVDAIEWCAAANLGLERRGVVPARIDVINLSLGEPWAQGSRFFDAALEAAGNAGIVVVAAAGNQGDRPFILVAPGSSPHALSVAASTVDAPADAIATYSSRGPSRYGALKPDLTAPGTNIRAAAMGTGGGASAASGTSMATPHVAGAAALLLQGIAVDVASGALAHPLGAADVEARLVNSTRAIVHDGFGGAPVSVTRQGAGRLDVARAATATLSVRVGDGASINLGRWPRTAGAPRSVVMDAFNPTDRPITFTLTAHPRPGAPPALAVAVPVEPLVAPPRGRVPVTATFTLVEGSFLPSGDLGAAGAIPPAALDGATSDGWLRFALLDAHDGPRQDAIAPSVPYAAIVRATSLARVDVAPDGLSLRLGQPASSLAADAPVDLFHLLTPAEGDPDEPGVRYEADLRHVGARWLGVGDGAARRAMIQMGDGAARVDALPAAHIDLADNPTDQGPPRLSIGLARWAPAVVPYGVLVRILLDADGDGVMDRVALAGPESAVMGGGTDDRMVVGVAPWDAAAAAPVGRPQEERTLPFTVDSRVLIVDIPLADLGLAAPRAVPFIVESIGLLEDWLPLDDGDGLVGDAVRAVDVVPDGATADGGPRLIAPAPGDVVAPERMRALLAPGDAVDVPLVGRCGAREGSYLALVATNLAMSGDGAAGDVFVLEPGRGQARRAGGCRVWLPVGWRAVR